MNDSGSCREGRGRSLHCPPMPLRLLKSLVAAGGSAGRDAQCGSLVGLENMLAGIEQVELLRAAGEGGHVRQPAIDTSLHRRGKSTQAFAQLLSGKGGVKGQPAERPRQFAAQLRAAILEMVHALRAGEVKARQAS